MLRSVHLSLLGHYSPRCIRSIANGGYLTPRLFRPAWSQDTISRSFQIQARQRQSSVSTVATADENADLQHLPLINLVGDATFVKTLPVVCPGCGALSQTVEPDAPGFFSLRKEKSMSDKKRDETAIFRDAMSRLEKLDGKSQDSLPSEPTQQILSNHKSNSAGARSICDRCHDLIYQSKGQSIIHPSMESIRQMIEASPYQRNHIYHVLDAADFPMSLIPNLVASLDLPKLRTRNRRSKSMHYSKGRTADVSFIITRSDLLAPKKEQVDRMMPYLQEILRESLGRGGKSLRLGNVRCVSAKRGWWTPSVKQEIWERGGAGWVVGKVNVGKSALFEVVFPKGRSHTPEEAAKLAAVRDRNNGTGSDVVEGIAISDMHDHPTDQPESSVSHTSNIELKENRDGDATIPGKVNESLIEDDDEFVDDEEDVALLPPAQPETQYPQMPVVSSLPGTTASPIRLPYGKGRGELIDLPGIQRSSMETHVRPEYWASLVMKSRIVPEQWTIKPGQSLLIGGIIRITPKTDDLIFLAYPFTPLKAHVTRHEKAIAIQTGKDQDGLPYSGTIESIATDTAKQRIKSAGSFQLEWDVTKIRTGPLTAKDAGRVKVENLPFTVYSTDILIESVGWVELVCQVRSNRSNLTNPFPEVEVFTPKGKFIAARRPMNAWVLGGPKKVAKHAARPRPRSSISMQRRKEGGKKASPAT